MTKNNFSETLVEDYDLFAKVFPQHDELQLAVMDSVIDHFKTQHSDGGKALQFLDVGAGYGFTSKLVANTFPNAQYILNDFEESQLARSDQFMRGYKVVKKVGDIEDVIAKIPDGSIDAVYTAWVIHNFPKDKRSRVYSEIARVLKKGGLFVNLEKVGDSGEQREANLAQTIVDLTPFITKYHRPDLFLEWVRHDLRDDGPDLLFSDEENEMLLKNNGFTWKYKKQILLEKVISAVKK